MNFSLEVVDTIESASRKNRAIIWLWISIYFLQETLMTKRNEGRHFILDIRPRMQSAYGYL
jgi:hypothetical protein